MPAVHRHGDLRTCGATTTVTGQNSVFINGKLASVLDDPNSHGRGQLTASNNTGSVFVGGKLLVLLDSGSQPDLLCQVIGPPHCNPRASSASPDVFACDGPAGAAAGGNAGGGGGGVGGGAAGPSQNTPSRNIPASPGVTNVLGRKKLDEDPAFQEKLDEMIRKYPGLTKDEIYRVIQGESGFDSAIVNRSTGATGLFQFIPSTANELGYTTAQIQSMTPAQQLAVYDRYLSRWNYQGGQLGIMQAAPAFANRSPDTEVYSRGSRAWSLNPGWRGPDGRITVQSINDYYSRQG
jgi:hypothetical protein